MQCFENLSADSNSKPFLKACKLYFSTKNCNILNYRMLLENDKLLLKQKDVASTVNKHFGSIADSLNLFRSLYEKPYFLFEMFRKHGLPKKLALEYDLSCSIWKDGISFSRKFDLIL